MLSIMLGPLYLPNYYVLNILLWGPGKPQDSQFSLVSQHLDKEKKFEVQCEMMLFTTAYLYNLYFLAS